MATDNIYPLGINTTTGKPEVASTAYSGIAGDFVRLLDGSSSGSDQLIDFSAPAAGVVTLFNNNTSAAGYSRIGTGAGPGAVVFGEIQAYGTSYGGSNEGLVKFVAVSEVGSAGGLVIASLDTGSSGAYTTFRSASTDVWKLGAEGQDPITISPTALAANTDNYDPTSFAGSEILRISASAAYNLTGIVAPTTGSRRITLQNVGAENITLVNNATSTAANRFQLSIGINTVLAAGDAVTLVYDDTSSRWRDESYNLKGVYTTLGSVFDTLYIQTDGGAGVQTVQLDANAETSITVQNDDTGASATAGYSAVCDGNTLSISAISDAGGVRPGKISISANSTNGLDIDSATTTSYQSGAVTKMVINAMGRVDSPGTQALTAVGNTITPTSTVMTLSSDGNYTLTSTPTIAAGTASGQRLTLVYSGANTVTLQRESALAGSTLRLGAATRALSEYDTLELIWNGTYWLETSFTDNT